MLKKNIAVNNSSSSKGNVIVDKYLNFLDKHIEELLEGQVQNFMTLREIAVELAISHQHLTDIVKKNTGKHPCSFYEDKILEQAKNMLSNSSSSSAEIAQILTYDPSNFSKFFKKKTGLTPGQYRNRKNHHDL